ncbi:DNA cytosine methyltransferase [Dethiosulfovibrio salsuginis]|uniref:Cytosine-specific methyltransferase n=1 Tax=Dethiosulfovibrio salsuginis TaxID=561720 RepID=A0A1X7IL03_9BACT|nr:DNA cytosine methyltransferase [Dethiosulfovibrio salsuginis]SMG15596.1 DNA (cytosine-5)-methyltransferase 1 [Dethiosulfovibrio salsuginis]
MEQMEFCLEDIGIDSGSNLSSKSLIWDDFKFIDLFAGIGGIRIAFESVGGKCVFSSEWDDRACETYFANFGEHPEGDITKINTDKIPDFNILLAGFPCQPFSIIGDRTGFNHETQGTLFFDIERILAAKMPLAFMLENVRNLTAHESGRTFKIIIAHLESLGYYVHYKVLNALDFGVPQKRERIIICGFKHDVPFCFPKPVPESEKLSLQDILEPNEDLDEKLWVNDSIRLNRMLRMKKFISTPYITHENVSGSVTPHHFSCALRAGASANYMLINNERRLSAREMLRLQGFPDDFKIVVPYSSIRKQTGNSVAIPVIKAVARQMLKALRHCEEIRDYD